jgi:iron(III) transport system permease protein
MALTDPAFARQGPYARIAPAKWLVTLLTALGLLALALLLATPWLAAAFLGASGPSTPFWQEAAGLALPRYWLGSLAVMGLTALLSVLFGVSAGWLVSMCRFPGRGLLEWLLILPLAAPAYVLAYAYGDVLGVSGPVQSLLRDATGLSARQLWFPDITSLPGAAFVLACALFPYVYLAARAGFTTQSACALEAAQTCGAKPWRAFWRIGLPGARPALAGGALLVAMEAGADYGTVSHFGVDTLSTGVVRAWGSFGDAGAAGQMALSLLALALLLQWAERSTRGQAGYAGISARWRPLPRYQLRGFSALAASGGLFALFALAFAIPVGRLIWLAFEYGVPTRGFFNAVLSSTGLAALATAVILAVSGGVALIGRAALASHGVNGLLVRLVRLACTAGYAVPGAVMALGAAILLGELTSLFAGQSEARVSPAALSAFSLMALIWVYLGRFSEAGVAQFEGALSRAGRSLGWAGASLGAGPLRRAFAVDAPIAATGLLSATLIVFVEVLKELPATLMLRPLEFDTLAVRAHAYASDERLGLAAAPALTLVLIGLLPIIVLSGLLSSARPGAKASQRTEPLQDEAGFSC